LIKPQFEAGRENISKGGVVRDENIVRDILSESLLFFQKLGYGDLRLDFSRLPGPRGNVEYFCYAAYGGAKQIDSGLIDRIMQEKADFYSHK
jgi:23S rRNA (cytidine1920-2'-O)/16S rRNA (cytidine1409-2'-O)-methyltransferase